MVAGLGKAAAIAVLSLRVVARDRGALLWRIAMPLIMTVLFGSVYGGAAQSARLPVAVADQDRSDYSRLFAERLSIERSVRVVEATAAEAAAMLDAGRVAVAVVVPKGFADRINAGKNSDVSVRYDERRGVPTLVLEVVREVVMRLSVDALAGEFTAAVAVRHTQNPSLAPAIRRRATERADTRWSPTPPVTVAVEAATAFAPERRPRLPSGMEQTSPGFTVMFVMMAAAMSAGALVVERRNGTLARLLTTPTHRASILAGKIAGIYAQGVVQIAILIGVGQTLLGVNWGQSPAALAAVAAAYLFAATGLGIMLGAVVRTEAQASTLFPVVVIIPSMLGGAWWPVEIMPSYMQALARAVPQGWAMAGFVNIITRGFGLAEAAPQVLALAGFGTAFFVVGVALFRFE